MISCALLALAPQDGAHLSAAAIARETRERHLVQGLVCAVVGKEGVRDIGAAGIRRKGAPETVPSPLRAGTAVASAYESLLATLELQRRAPRL